MNVTMELDPEEKKLYFVGLEFIFRRIQATEDIVLVELEMNIHGESKKILMTETEFSQLAVWLDHRRNPWV